MKETFLIGRLLAGGYFIYGGLEHFASLAAMAQAAAHRGVPMPTAAVIGAGILLLIGGISFLFGLMPKIGVLALAVFLVPVTLMMHPFWKEHGSTHMFDLINFTKNVGLLGMVLMAVAVPEPWPLSLQTRLHLPRRVWHSRT